MKKVIISILIMCIIWNVSGCTTKNAENTRQEKMSVKELYKLNSTCVKVKKDKIKMEDETSGTVQLTVTIPDYSSLYCQAVKERNPDIFIQDSLEKGNFKTVKKTVSAEVTVKNGKKVVHEEKAVEKVMEEALNEAVDKIMEE